MPKQIRILSKKWRAKISESVKRQWSEGRGNFRGLLTKKSRKKQRLAMLGHKRTPIGKKHWLWKGNRASYGAIHQWVYRHFGKANKCENIDCVYPRKNWDGEIMQKPKKYEWANISGKYKRQREDWQMLCPSCHRIRDIKIKKVVK